MTTQPEPFERLLQYVGRNEAKILLVKYAYQTISHPECNALYFEGQGGLGKTRLLQLASTILREEMGTESEHLRFAELIDFYKFENRDPLVIEQRLIDGLKQPSDAALVWYRLPVEEVDLSFADYTKTYSRYRQAQESRDSERIEQEREQMRVTFIDGWNNLSQTHPIVIAFDTLETLFFRAPADALINRTAATPDITNDMLLTTAGVDLVLKWIERVLPMLQHTLVLFSGRPVRDNENKLAVRLRELNLLREHLYRLQPFTAHADIQDYLRAYIGERADCDDIDLYYIQQITDGRPLLLTCYAETRRAADALPPGLPVVAPDECTSRAGFEDWLIATLLNPLAATQGLRQQTLAYCLYFLVYARRGIRVSELQALFESENISYDLATITQLAQVALVKQSGDMLFLHDEIFAMIDASRKPDAIGLRQPTLSYLCDVSVTAVHQAAGHGATDELLGAMANHMYYEMTRDIEYGYFTYAIYIDRLLELRGRNPTLVLSDAFWRTLNYEVVVAGGSEQPYRDALQWSHLSEERILRDEQVRYVGLLQTLPYKDQALAEAQRLLQNYHQAGLIPDPQEAAQENPLSRYPELYLFITSGLKRIYIGMTSGDKSTQQMERLCKSIIDLLETTSTFPDRLLELRRHYFLGDAYNAMGQLYSLQNRLDEALDAGRKALLALERYQQQINQKQALNDDITITLAQTRNNLAYDYTRRGDFDAARQLSLRLDHMLRTPDMRRMLPIYRQVLFFNTRALIEIERTNYLAAEKPLREAERLIEEEGVQDGRVRGLVLWARAQLNIAYMKESDAPDLDIDTIYRHAYALLEKNKSLMPEFLERWASYYRHLAYLYSNRGNKAEQEHYLHEANSKLEEALGLPLDGNDIKRAALFGSKATIANLLCRYNDAINNVQRAEHILKQAEVQVYGQIVSGRIALQRADLLLHHEHNYQAALEQVLIALARVYTFAEKHRDQETFEEVAHRFIADIPISVLEKFQEDVNNFQLAVNQLSYQIPEAPKWLGALQRSKRKLDSIITNYVRFAPPGS